MNKILDTVKQTLGISVSDTSFDVDILLYINTTLSILSQLGLEEADKFPIVDETNTWDQLIGTRTDLEMIKSYIRFKVKMMFDPPASSAALDATNKVLSELEWRINNLKLIRTSAGGGD